MKALSILFLALAVSGFADDFAEDPKGHFDSSDVWGPRFKTDPQHFPDFKPGTRRHLDSVRRWNEIAIDASGFDHANAREQLGPGRASRAMAIVHIAMFDTINAVIRQYDSYADFRAPSGAISLEAAVSQAAHDTLDFVKYTSEDPLTGSIVTDWYSPPGNPNIRYRVNVFVLARALRSDSLAVTVDRQQLSANGQWAETTIARQVETDIENAILSRSRQLKRAWAAAPS